MKRIIHNLVVLFTSLVAYYFFVENYSEIIPPDYQWYPFLAVFTFPFIFGALACYLFRGFSVLRAILVALIPIVVFSPALTSVGDPAKPGLEYYIYMVFIVNFCVGAFSEIGGYYLFKHIKQKNTPNKSLKHDAQKARAS